MSSRSLGRWTVRPVGVGELSLTVAAARGIDRAGVTRALHVALEAGFDLVDIAAEDDTEHLAGETLRALRLRDKVIAAIRIPAIGAREGVPTRDVLSERLPARYIVARVEQALRATRLDALPLAQLELRASWLTSSRWPEIVGTCANLVREGKVLDWGALVERVEDDTAELVRQPWLVALSIPFSLCERAGAQLVDAAEVALTQPLAADTAQATTGLTSEQMRAAGLSPDLVIAAGLPAELVLAAVTAPPPSGEAPPPRPARDTPLAVLARRPLGGGALAGALGPGVKLKPRDDRNAIDPDALERIAVAIAKLARFVKHTPPAARSCDAAKMQLEINQRPDHVDCQSVAELALRYVVARGFVALPRLHRHEHVAEALAASVLPLPTEVVDQLEL